MDDSMPEVIITSSKTCNIYNAKTKSELRSYKDTNTFAPKTLSLIGDDFLIGAYANKPMMKVWRIKKEKDHEEQSFVVPGVVSTLAVSSHARYCIAGIKDQIYVWEIESGEMLIILSRHYQPVSCLKFTADDSRFLSGGSDGHVIVWITSSVVDVTARSDTVKPQYVWTHHSAEVTDIYSGNSVSRVATTSLDMTCRVYEIYSGILLVSIYMDVPLTCVIMDPLENYIYLGDECGTLYRINTYERLPLEIHRADMNNKAALKIHETKIISLHISFDGTQLLTASADGSLKVWDVGSMACLFRKFFEGGLTNVFLALEPMCLSVEGLVPQLVVRNFERVMTPKDDNKERVRETRLSNHKLSLMYEGCPDNFYERSVFCSKPVLKVDALDITEAEDVFREKARPQDMKELIETNQKITAYALTLLEKTFDDKPIPS